MIITLDYFRHFASFWSYIRAFQKELKLAVLWYFGFKRSSLRILLKVLDHLISLVLNYVRFMTILLNLRQFAQPIVTSVPLKDLSKGTELWHFYSKRSILEPPLWVLWRCTMDFIGFASNYVWFLTILVNLRYFTHVGIASGPFKHCSKLAELWIFCWKGWF